MLHAPQSRRVGPERAALFASIRCCLVHINPSVCQQQRVHQDTRTTALFCHHQMTPGSHIDPLVHQQHPHNLYTAIPCGEQERGTFVLRIWTEMLDTSPSLPGSAPRASRAVTSPVIPCVHAARSGVQPPGPTALTAPLCFPVS